jgi:hypothetical protein
VETITAPSEFMKQRISSLSYRGILENNDISEVLRVMVLIQFTNSFFTNYGPTLTNNLSRLV